VDSHWDPVVHISAQQRYVGFLVYLKTCFSNLDYIASNERMINKVKMPRYHHAFNRGEKSMVHTHS
jgi:hypothetical protein